MLPATWLLDDASPLSVAACGDPAESLARQARLNGETVLTYLRIMSARYGPRIEIDELSIHHYARAAFRFAAAALVLSDADEIDRRIAQLLDQLTAAIGSDARAAQLAYLIERDGVCPTCGRRRICPDCGAESMALEFQNIGTAITAERLSDAFDQIDTNGVVAGRFGSERLNELVDRYAAAKSNR